MRQPRNETTLKEAPRRGPKPMISLGKWQSGPSPGTPRAKDKIKNHFKHSQVLKGLKHMHLLGRPGPREPPKSAGNGGPGPDLEIGVGDRLGTLRVSRSKLLSSI
jgi:hypothetical protein